MAAADSKVQAIDHNDLVLTLVFGSIRGEHRLLTSGIRKPPVPRAPG
jgi:hypothetical protein